MADGKRVLTEVQRQRKRERSHEWYLANRERITEQQRQYYLANRERILQRNKAYNESLDPQIIIDRNRRWRQANQQKIKARRRADKHGPGADADWASMWASQQGRCYLCGTELIANPEAASRSLNGGYPCIDHDHRCCPKDRSCRRCRRGLACGRCNALIGLAEDDPDLLLQIADNLEAALTAFESRQSAWHQASLLDEAQLYMAPPGPVRGQHRAANPHT